MRSLSIGVFCVTVPATIATAVYAGMTEFEYGIVEFWLAAFSILLSIIAYQACAVRESTQPGDESAILLMAAIAELRAIRSEREEGAAGADQEADAPPS